MKLLIEFGAGGVELRNFYDAMAKLKPGSFYWSSRFADHLFAMVSKAPERYYDLLKKEEIQNEAYEEPDLNEFNAWQRNVRETPFFVLPIKDRLQPFSSPLNKPLTTAFLMHHKAITLASSDEDMAKYHQQLAALFEVVQKFDSAALVYVAAYQFSHGDQDIRVKAAQAFRKAIYLSDCFAQLDTLFRENRLLVKDQIPFAEMAIYKGEQETALKVLNADAAKLGVSNNHLLELKGRSYFVSKSDKAISFFEDTLKGIISDKERFYAIAASFAQKGQKENAFLWLEKSIKAGFNYGYLLKYDSPWDLWRNDPKWDTVTSGMKPLQYKAAPGP